LLAQAPLEKNSTNERIQFIEDTHALIRDNGLWGIGLNQTTATLYTQDDKNNVERDVSTYQPVHVVPLLVWQEIGLFGLLAWLACLALPFIPFFRATDSVFFASYLGLLVISLWDHYLWSLPFGILLFWIIWGLTLNPHTHTKQ
jgi:O-antigen ligase